VEEGVHLSDPEVWQLIFMPGFSTADAVTDLSGRGVGMDVVKRNIESLRGQIALSSREGHGTTTQVRLPLTLAMIDGFLTMVGGAHYVLPLAVVAECIDLPPECHQHPERVAGTFDLRGEVLPYLDLAHFYGLSSDISHHSTPQGHPGPSRRSLVMVREGTIRVGLVVDRLLGEHQTVIKPLPAIFRDLRALAGSTILGSGEVALVLDLPGLMAAAKQALRALSNGEGSRRARGQPALEKMTV
jgi:two-component system chemotaxis sensor kinase CheA